MARVPPHLLCALADQKAPRLHSLAGAMSRLELKIRLTVYVPVCLVQGMHDYCKSQGPHPGRLACCQGP